ncbi:hypothetical protein EV368DRAFT_66968 [Lentinula lateritia]|nr:hypothetical protein EV368DRAFT_66968 [Lentinula lateritia]
MIIIFLLYLVGIVQAAIPSSTFSLYSLNANGLGSTVKIHHINTAIHSMKPHAFILNESKTNASVINDLPSNEYEIFEEHAVNCKNSQLYKWGTVLGIRKDIQVINRLQISDVTLRGRVVAVDIAVQTSNGQAFIYRIFGVYAPWDSGNIKTQQFWPKLTQIIRQTQTSWSLAGDTNATVNTEERSIQQFKKNTGIKNSKTYLTKGHG